MKRRHDGVDVHGKAPSFAFYPADWLSDSGLRSCSLAARGLWMELLCHCHFANRRGYLEHANGQALTIKCIANLASTRQELIRRLMQELESAGVFSRDENGVIYSRRMSMDARISAIRKASGQLGGNPNLVNQKSTKTENKVNQTPNQNPTLPSPSPFPSPSPPASNQTEKHSCNESSSVGETDKRTNVPPAAGKTEPRFDPPLPGQESAPPATVLVPQASPLAEQWIGVFLAAGCKLSEQDIMRAYRGSFATPGFLTFDAATQQRILDYTIQKAKSHEAKYMGLPINLLNRREWERNGPGRLLPEPRRKTRAEENFDKASRAFLAEGNSQ